MKITMDKIKDFDGIEAKELFAAQPDFVKKIVLAMDKGKNQFDEVLYTYHTTGASKWLQTDYVRTAKDNVMVITKDISERKEAEAKLLAYQEQLRALTSELILIEERERRRIASELHDQIGQNLALCKLKVAALEKDMTQQPGEKRTVGGAPAAGVQHPGRPLADLRPQPAGPLRAGLPGGAGMAGRMDRANSTMCRWNSRTAPGTRPWRATAGDPVPGRPRAAGQRGQAFPGQPGQGHPVAGEPFAQDPGQRRRRRL